MTTSSKAGADGAGVTSSVPLPSLKRVLSSGQGQGAAGGAPLRLARQLSGGRAAAPAEWRTFMSIEERQSVRTKIRDAYTRHAGGSFEELLDTAVALGEELLYQSAPSRLDYFRSGLEFDACVRQKRAALDGAGEGRDAKKARADDDDGEEEEEGSD